MIRFILGIFFCLLSGGGVMYIFNYTESGRMFLDNLIFRGINIYPIRDNIALNIHDNVVVILCQIISLVTMMYFLIITDPDNDKNKKE